jgi:two-component system LytT family response regulator
VSWSHDRRKPFDPATVKHSTVLSLALDEPVPRRILISDPNLVTRRAVRLALESRVRNIAVVECESDTAAAAMIERDAVDVVLLDATSSGGRALMGVREMRISPTPVLVVITSAEHLATAVSDFSAADYVVRPFSSDRLSLAIERAFARLDERHPRRDIIQDADSVPTGQVEAQPATMRSEIARPTARGHAYRRRFLVSIGTRDVVVHTEDLAWVRANGYCVTLVTRDRKEYLVRLPLDQLEEELDPDEFIRIHRSAIVRFQELHEIERSASRSMLAVLRSGARIPVSRSRRDGLLRALGGA